MKNKKVPGRTGPELITRRRSDHRRKMENKACQPAAGTGIGGSVTKEPGGPRFKLASRNARECSCELRASAKRPLSSFLTEKAVVMEKSVSSSQIPERHRGQEFSAAFWSFGPFGAGASRWQGGEDFAAGFCVRPGADVDAMVEPHRTEAKFGTARKKHDTAATKALIPAD